jgi:hypothetical protein
VKGALHERAQRGGGCTSAVGGAITRSNPVITPPMHRRVQGMVKRRYEERAQLAHTARLAEDQGAASVFGRAAFFREHLWGTLAG